MTTYMITFGTLAYFAFKKNKPTDSQFFNNFPGVYSQRNDYAIQLTEVNYYEPQVWLSS